MPVEDSAAARLARLTEREKECLRRCLHPQTAKEMAVDLGVSPHAVEKRLKMARAKLGVSSSLVAARMLAAAEGYERVVPQDSDLPKHPVPSDTSGIAAPIRHSPRRYVIGGLGMIAIAVLIAFFTQDATDPSIAPITQDGRPVSVRKVGWNEAQQFLSEAFRLRDTDKSGYLDAQELSTLEPRDASRDPSLPPAPPADQRDPAAERKWLAKMDTDHDGQIDEQEYISYMIPWTLLSGVPATWHPAKPPTR